jgi:hypothetical protein
LGKNCLIEVQGVSAAPPKPIDAIANGDGCRSTSTLNETHVVNLITAEKEATLVR